MTGRPHLSEVARILASAFDSTLVRWLAGAAAAVWSYFSPTGATARLAVLIAVLVCLDMVTGVRASLKRGEYLSSRLWSRIVDKTLAYGSLIVIATVVPRNMSEVPFLAMVGDFVLGAACIGEMISILENLVSLGVRWLRPITKALKIRFAQLIEDEAGTITGHTVSPASGEEDKP